MARTLHRDRPEPKSRVEAMSNATHKINEAIHACLDRCYSAKLPVACMAEFLESLRTDPAWLPGELDAVEQRVRHILTLIVEEPGPGRRSA